MGRHCECYYLAQEKSVEEGYKVWKVAAEHAADARTIGRKGGPYRIREDAKMAPVVSINAPHDDFEKRMEALGLRERGEFPGHDHDGDGTLDIEDFSFFENAWSMIDEKLGGKGEGGEGSGFDGVRGKGKLREEKKRRTRTEPRFSCRCTQHDMQSGVEASADFGTAVNHPT